MRAPIVLRSGPIIQLPYKPEPDLSCEEIELAQNYLLYEDQRVCPPSKEHEAQYSLCEDAMMKLIIMHHHELMKHGRVDTTLASVLQQFWSPKIRQCTKHVLQGCLPCRARRAQAYRLPPMAPIPRERLSGTPAFQNIGIDYLGPVHIRRIDGSKTKIWVCLMVCMVTRAVHLELILDLTVESFIRAFRRFIARRGRPSLVLSDNATTFVAAAKVLGRLLDEIAQYLSTQTIIWRFIPQLTPWAGGFYERLVGTTKKAFKNTVGRKTLTFEEATTVFTEVEAVVNCRPLTYVHEGAHIRVLRPIDLIGTGSHHTALFFNDREEAYVPGRMGTKEEILVKWKADEQLVHSFYDQLTGEKMSRNACRK
ncbi:Pao retrotransposon peptidase family protein-like protein [Aphelenchoides avenae]|nr:Pao retrotransposon peptidase family protein-like protein [Aphelenchus avenae]